MTLHIGIDLGTSGIKAVLFEGLDRPLAEAKRPVAVSRPRVGWAEQDPDLWVEAVFACLDEVAAARPDLMPAVAGIGLSGQMLAALLLDEALRPILPAMLWNDQRALAECAELLARVPDIGRRTNGAPDPGITAPKLLWLARHEPEGMGRARMLLLTKDYMRLGLPGEAALVARRLVAMDHALAGHRVDDRRRRLERRAGLVLVAALDGRDGLLDGRTDLGTLRHVVGAALDGLAGTLFGRLRIGQGNAPSRSVSTKPNIVRTGRGLVNRSGVQGIVPRT